MAAKVLFITIDNDRYSLSGYSQGSLVTVVSADCRHKMVFDLDIETAEAFVDHLETCIAEAKRFRDSKNEKD